MFKKRLNNNFYKIWSLSSLKLLKSIFFSNTFHRLKNCSRFYFYTCIVLKKKRMSANFYSILKNPSSILQLSQLWFSFTQNIAVAFKIFEDKSLVIVMFVKIYTSNFNTSILTGVCRAKWYHQCPFLTLLRDLQSGTNLTGLVS